MATRLGGRWLLFVAPAAGAAEESGAARAFRSHDIAIADQGDGQFPVLLDGHAVEMSVPQLHKGAGRRGY